jgi:dTDP-D-glucose 4,6-dehydratase
MEQDVMYVEDRKGHDWSYAMSNQKLLDIVGNHAFMKFSAAIDSIVRYYSERFGRGL